MITIIEIETHSISFHNTVIPPTRQPRLVYSTTITTFIPVPVSQNDNLIHQSHTLLSQNRKCINVVILFIIDHQRTLFVIFILLILSLLSTTINNTSICIAIPTSNPCNLGLSPANSCTSLLLQLLYVFAV